MIAYNLTTHQYSKGQLSRGFRSLVGTRGCDCEALELVVGSAMLEFPLSSNFNQ